MRRGKLLVLLGGMCLVLVLTLLPLLAACAKPAPAPAPAPAPTPAKVYELKMQSHMPIDNPVFQRTQRWGKIVEERSNGQIKFTFYPSNQLAPMGESLDAVAAGAFDMLVTSGNIFAGKNNISGFVSLPVAFPARENLDDAWVNKGLDKIVDEVYQERSNVKVLNLQHVSWSTLHSTKPVRKLEDWKGLKVGALGAVRANYAKFVGATSVNIPPQEQYVAVQRGTVDAAVQPIYGLKSYALYEVVDYTISKPTIFPITLLVWINIDTWNSLPKDLQKLLHDTGIEAMSDDIEWINDTEAEDIAWGKEKGVEMIEIPPAEYKTWLDAVAGLNEQYIEDCEKQGLGDEARKVIAIADTYR